MKTTPYGTGPLGEAVEVVDGAAVRNGPDTDWIGGGHDLSDAWIPCQTIYVEQLQPADQRAVVLHECVERALMHCVGLPYAHAHDLATVAERLYRHGVSATDVGTMVQELKDLPEDFAVKLDTLLQPSKTAALVPPVSGPPESAPMTAAEIRAVIEIPEVRKWFVRSVKGLATRGGFEYSLRYRRRGDPQFEEETNVRPEPAVPEVKAAAADPYVDYARGVLSDPQRRQWVFDRAAGQTGKGLMGWLTDVRRGWTERSALKGLGLDPSAPDLSKRVASGLQAYLRDPEAQQHVFGGRMTPLEALAHTGVSGLLNLRQWVTSPQTWATAWSDPKALRRLQAGVTLGNALERFGLKTAADAPPDVFEKTDTESWADDRDPDDPSEHLYHIVRGPKGVLLGFVKVTPKDQALEVSNLWVDRSARGKGLGKQLMERTLSHGLPVELDAEPFDGSPFGDKELQSFYSKLGFKVTSGSRMRHDGEKRADDASVLGILGSSGLLGLGASALGAYGKAAPMRGMAPGQEPAELVRRYVHGGHRFMTDPVWGALTRGWYSRTKFVRDHFGDFARAEPAALARLIRESRARAYRLAEEVGGTLDLRPYTKAVDAVKAAPTLDAAMDVLKRHPNVLKTVANDVSGYAGSHLPQLRRLGVGGAVLAALGAAGLWKAAGTAAG